ncbi:hypothetical protein JR316_0012435 [Psilocybe cubensis]|uniref:DUF6699 domain-containing protein n=2 Tax=Psilocybe cubensis TaxID=181762 RepID=A0A8H7XM22_PSICU|nr:hypothetical protein JR316_0012435 [Psilocybe cubensis]KAH9475324.1 hypothetical protein JR316_0012435 [Psilocybe cubensis]
MSKQQKHVRFDDTPSPASSSSSLPSEEEPCTPPPLGFNSPYHCTPLPGTSAVNPFLEPKNGMFNCDITQHPVYMAHSVPAHIWDQPATHPSAPSLVVVCDRLPWMLTIYPTSSHRSYVTVRDVFDGIYTALRKPVLTAELATLSPAGKAAVTAAYHERCRRIVDPEMFEMEMSKGFKRVDFLGKHTTFYGIKSSKVPGRWDLMLK